MRIVCSVVPFFPFSALPAVFDALCGGIQGLEELLDDGGLTGRGKTRPDVLKLGQFF